MELASYNKSSPGRIKPGTGKSESALENSIGALHYYRYALVFHPEMGPEGDQIIQRQRS